MEKKFYEATLFTFTWRFVCADDGLGDDHYGSGGTVSECTDSNHDGRCDICKEAFKSDKASGTNSMIVVIAVVGVIVAVGATVLIMKNNRKRK